ncbi:MAG: hypothetical protein Hyperionvirus12_38 [Hyperionvirus sp.]|uniref:VWFA domain-containing protein n=1 Tax=Hyperionvirus sp. TaxID=2487770 RepID=A0A3G5AC37_9VIRU|nr:MAG: hypothetical protein Hyperionvirus12_38 [Hyperionvirus sp.]
MTTLKLFPAFNGYVGKLIVGDGDRGISRPSAIETIVILDVSGSMGDNVQKMITDVIPKTFLNLGYKATDQITLITFHNKATTYHTAIENFAKSTIKADGGTYMVGAITHLKNYLTTAAASKHLRILTISDGALHDQDLTVTESAKLVGELGGGYTINSQAVRLFTSESQPDTRGLSSVMQLNSVCECKLLDIKTYDNVVEVIGDLFKRDNLDKSIMLSSSNEIFMTAPWLPPSNKIYVNNADSVIWFKEIPKNIRINEIDKELKIEICSQLNFDNFDLIMKDKIDYYINRLKVLKVVNSEAAIKEIGEIVGYFGELEKGFHAQDALGGSAMDTSLRTRSEYYRGLIAKKSKSVVFKMSQIANDDKVAKLNSMQQAEYLRTVDVSKNAKGLARRAVTGDIDFDGVVRKEVLEMFSHLDELSGVDDSKHAQSFYSRETTLGGIRATCELVKAGMLDELNANDILTMINIVGVPCSSVVGNYPDPMTWRVDNIYVSCYLSLSDILMAHIVSGGKALKAVGLDKEISNVIPFFDDDRVHIFMKKYAPSILEYSASVGMRRMIMNVHMTYTYTVCAGVWKMVQELNVSKSDINVQTFERLKHSYEVAVGGHFDHVLKYMVDQDEKLSYYLGNNGVTNMIGVLMKIIKGGNTKNVRRIMRALYSYEINQAVKRKYKYLEHGDVVMREDLNKLVGLDLERFKTKTQELLVAEDEKVEFYDKYHVGKELLGDLLKGCWYVDYLTLLPEFLGGDVKAVGAMDEKSVGRALGIDYDLKMYQFFTIVQSMLYNNKQDRVDSDGEKMLIDELGDFAVGDSLVREYVRKQYQNKYTSDLTFKIKAEKDVLSEKLINKMLGVESVQEFSDLFEGGIVRGKAYHKIVNKASLGYNDLKMCLLNMKIDVPERLGKLKVLLLGRDDKDKIVWNNGNTLAVDLKEFKDVIVQLAGEEGWMGVYDEYAVRNVHIYRLGKANRHSHCNEKPSYWAFGFLTIDAYARSITHEAWLEYKKIHHDCCGVRKLNF